MKKLLICAVVSIFAASSVFAGNSTLVYTTAQSTAIQTQLIPAYNRAHCRRFGATPTCNTAQLVSAGCVTVTKKTVVLDSCVIFSQDATGEAAYLQERSNQAAFEAFVQLDASLAFDFCSTWTTMTTTQRNNICASLTPALPAGCAPCQIP